MAGQGRGISQVRTPLSGYCYAVMRLGVLDVGSNTVHMLVVDAYPGARPLPAFSHKTDLSLAAHLERDNTLSRVGEERLTEVVAEALRIAEDKGVEDFLAFATSAVRDAVNGDDVLARIQDQTGARDHGCCPARTRRG